MFKAIIRVLKRKLVSIPIVLIIVAILIWLGYQAPWTEFSQQSLWEWMKLLIVPIVLGIGAWLFRREDSKVERETTLDKQRQDTLMTYFDRMEKLLLQHGLRNSKVASKVRTVARARTLSVLRNLDGQRKGYVLQFLYESGLINDKNPIVNLEGANLEEAHLSTANLEGANLEVADLNEANLEGVNLCRANLKGAYLVRANLKGAYLVGSHLEKASLKEAHMEIARLKWALAIREWEFPDRELHHKLYLDRTRPKYLTLQPTRLNGAHLQGATLEGANLEGADLEGANLEGAILVHANLKKAILRKAEVKPEQLAEVKTLHKALMPDDTIWDNKKGLHRWKAR